MTRRVWKMALAAGLCGSLPACAPLGGAREGPTPNMVSKPVEPPAPAVEEPASPYAAIPQKEKRPERTASTVVEEPASPYAAIPQKEKQPSRTLSPAAPVNSPPTSPYAEVKPAAPPHAHITTLESAIISNPANLKQPPTPPLPPDPLTASPYAEILAGPPLATPLKTPKIISVAASANAEMINKPTAPRPSAGSGPSLDSTPISPYAEIPSQKSTLAPATSRGSETASLGPSPYGARSSQTPFDDSARAQQPNAAASVLSPYAPITNQAIRTSVGKIAAPSPEPASPYPTTPYPTTPIEPKKPNEPELLETSSSFAVDAETKVQQTTFPRDPEFHYIGEVPAAPPHQIDFNSAHEAAPQAVARPSKQDGDEPPLLKALRCFLDKRPAEAVQCLRRYDETNQELLLRLLPIATRLTATDITRNDAERATEILDEFNNLVNIPINGDLVISKLCLCKHIKTFGDYEPFPLDHAFQPRDLVWIYAEVRNFTSDRRDLGNGEIVFETSLMTTARITNYAGTHEWPLQFESRYGPDRSRTQRHDYWDNLSFNVPDLPPGGYTLWLKVVDKPTGRFKERSVDFQVAPAGG